MKKQREKKRPSGGKGEWISTKKGGQKSQRGRGQGDNSKGTQIRKQACNVGGLRRRH